MAWCYCLTPFPVPPLLYKLLEGGAILLVFDASHHTWILWCSAWLVLGKYLLRK